MPPVTPESRTPRATVPPKPAWASTVDRFYANSFDATNRAALHDSTEAWASMDPEEQSFHAAHLAFRQVQALADIHGTLQGIERSLSRFDPKAIASLRYLPAVKRALDVIGEGQQEMLEVLEAGAAGNMAGDPDDADEPDDDDSGDDSDDDGADLPVDDDSEGSDDEESLLSQAIDLNDSGDDDGDTGPALVPEVLPAGSRRNSAASRSAA